MRKYRIVTAEDSTTVRYYKVEAEDFDDALLKFSKNRDVYKDREYVVPEEVRITEILELTN